jgi:hypothetical protein
MTEWNASTCSFCALFVCLPVCLFVWLVGRLLADRSFVDSDACSWFGALAEWVSRSIDSLSIHRAKSSFRFVSFRISEHRVSFALHRDEWSTWSRCTCSWSQQCSDMEAIISGHWKSTSSGTASWRSANYMTVSSYCVSIRTHPKLHRDRRTDWLTS